jgi:5-methylcytosine-specific restriction endonuclease McrA
MTKRDDIDRLYHTTPWKRARLSVLIRDHYLCQVCRREGRLTAANTVHHKEHARDNIRKFFDEDNLEAICMSCHDKEHPEKWEKAVNSYFAEKRKRIAKERAKGIVVFEQNRPMW